MKKPIISVSHLDKVYADGFNALNDISLDIMQGEILALLGPNGAGKTTLIGCICGLINPTSGSIRVGGFDAITQYKDARSLIGLVPQELTTDAFETVINSVRFSRGLFGLPRNDDYLESILKKLSLWDKKDNRLMTLSGGMKRRLMIAKALSHEPNILFLDEPSAGVDVELRRSMWELVHQLRESGVTIILTTHYIEEAEEMADRIGVINRGSIIVVEEKASLIKKLGSKVLTLEFSDIIHSLPPSLDAYALEIKDNTILYTYDSRKGDTGITALLEIFKREGHVLKDLYTDQSSLEDIFVALVNSK